MSENKKKKTYVNIGQTKEGQFGNYVQLGKENPKFPQYDYKVQVRVTDSTGKVVGTFTNPNISLMDPRKRPGITEEQAEKIPSYVINDLVIVVKED